MIVKLIKKLRLIILVIFFSILGAIYHYTIQDEWYIRYELKKSSVAQIYLKSVDSIILSADSSYLGKKRFKDHSSVFFADYTFKLNDNLKDYKKTSKLSEIQLSDSFLSFVLNDLEKADQIATQIIFEANKDLRQALLDRLKIFKNQIITSLNTEKKFRLEDLYLTLKFYKNKKITPLSLSPSASLTIDNYIIDQEDEKTKQFIKDLKEDLIQYEFYNAINRFELEIIKLEQKNVQDNPNLLSLDDYRDKISKVNIIDLRGKDKFFNRKPSLKYSIIAFGLFGLILYFVIIFFWVNRKTLKKLTLEKLLTLPNLK